MCLHDLQNARTAVKKRTQTTPVTDQKDQSVVIRDSSQASSFSLLLQPVFVHSWIKPIPMTLISIYIGRSSSSDMRGQFFPACHWMSPLHLACGRFILLFVCLGLHCIRVFVHQKLFLARSDIKKAVKLGQSEFNHLVFVATIITDDPDLIFLQSNINSS